ncbi:hypothetical protein F4824DRAFT_32630 [Ustulina deusta]|nr:hypothetical protein F4824DRAFT_32630 [Ustulina deusta]
MTVDESRGLIGDFLSQARGREMLGGYRPLAVVYLLLTWVGEQVCELAGWLGWLCWFAWLGWPVGRVDGWVDGRWMTGWMTGPGRVAKGEGSGQNNARRRGAGGGGRRRELARKPTVRQCLGRCKRKRAHVAAGQAGWRAIGRERVGLEGRSGRW